MGQQQLLLIILAIVIVGLAIVAGISIFRGSAVDAARDAVSLDVQDLGARAQAYYRKPHLLGGGGSSFTTSYGQVIGIGALTTMTSNNNGRYFIDPSASTAQRLVIVGKGNEVVGTDSVEVQAIVTSTSIQTQVVR
jgi:hypothetical protein